MENSYLDKKIVVYGAGAIGSFYGGLLKKAGFDVTLICRGKHLDVIRREGLTIKSYALGEINLKVEAKEKPEGMYDIAIISTKSHDTEVACVNLKEHLSDEGIVVSFQNGVDNKKVMEKYFRKDQIIIASLFVGLRVEPPGVVNHSAAGVITFGAIVNEGKRNVEILKNIFEQAGFQFKVTEEIEKVIWKKLLWNIAFNPTSALLESTCGKMVSNPDIKDLMYKMVLEGVKAAQFDGVEIEKEYYENVLNMTENLENYKTSMLQDIEKGKSPEIDGILKPVIDRLRENGVEACYCDTVYRALKFKYGGKFIYTPKLTVDVVVENDRGEILLISRKNPPYGWALPGGFVDYREKVEDAAKRELLEETGLECKDIKLLGVYSDPKRDPRGHTVSVVYYTKSNDDPIGMDDAKEARFFHINRLPSEIAFDHKKIIDDYLVATGKVATN